MTFITDRCWEDVARVLQGDHSIEALSRGTLLPATFQRWKEALLAIDPSLFLPSITTNTQINTTNPTIPIKGLSEYAEFSPLNDSWYYWKAVNDLQKKLPLNSDLDLKDFPKDMEDLTFANVNAIERVIEYFYNS